MRSAHFSLLSAPISSSPDSKVLTPQKREALFAKMNEPGGRIGYVVHSTSAAEISAAMLRVSPISLNVLSHDAAADMLEAVLSAGVHVAEVFVDTVGDPDYYQKRLFNHFNVGVGGGGGTIGRGWEISIVVSKKADSLYKTVSAGSIAAKVSRDRVLAAWQWDEPAFRHIVATPPAKDSGGDEEAAAAFSDGEDSDGGGLDEGGAAKEAAPGGGAARSLKRVRGADEADKTATPIAAGLRHPASAGSGYPGDPVTKAWVAAAFDARFGWPSVVRFSWAPAKDFMEKHGEKALWAEDIPLPAPGQPQLSSFFAASSAGSGSSDLSASGGGGGAAARSVWMRKRLLAPVTSL
jgi:ribonuclease HII